MFASSLGLADSRFALAYDAIDSRSVRSVTLSAEKAQTIFAKSCGRNSEIIASEEDEIESKSGKSLKSSFAYAHAMVDNS